MNMRSENRRLREWILGCIAFCAVAFAVYRISNALKGEPPDLLASPRPDLALPKTRLNVQLSAQNRKSPFRKDYSISQDWFTAQIPIWQQALQPYKGKPGQRYLEVGTFEGASLLWVIENILTEPTCSAVAIDPFLGEYKDRYRANLATSGFGDRVTTITGYSQVELRKQPLDSFDIIYVDGSHKASHVLEDAVLCLRLLKRGGTIIFDDYQWTGWTRLEPPEERPHSAIDVFYALFRDQLEVVHNDYQVILRRKISTSEEFPTLPGN